MAPERGEKMPGQVKDKELYSLIKKALREVLREERMEYFLRTISPVSSEEMDEIRETHGSPKGKKRAVYSVPAKI
jgi:hypothetical protein